MTLLLVAAMPREFDGLLRLASGVRKLAWPLDWARSADLAGARFLMAANGAGAARASEAVAAACRAERPDAVVSYGFCGALDPELRPGEVFVATEVQGPDGRFTAARPCASGPHASGPLASIGRVAQTSAEKAALYRTGAAAVDMEAAGVAAEAARQSLPFFCVRSVTDAASESFSVDFNSVMRPDGHLDTMYLLRSVVLRPLAVLPELIRLRGRCRVAALNLGEFIAGCRF